MDGGFTSGSWEGRPPCRPVPMRERHRWTVDLLLALGRDDLRVVRYRCGKGIDGRWICFWLLGGTTAVSSGTDAGKADITNNP